MASDGRATDISNSEIKSALSYTDDASKSQNGTPLKLDPASEDPVAVKGESEPIQEPIATEKIRAAKIHDFCFGIPFGKLLVMIPSKNLKK